MSAPTVLLLVAVWLIYGAFAFWAMLDSVYGDRRLPGVVGSPVGLLAMFAWVVVPAVPVVVLSTWVTM